MKIKRKPVMAARYELSPKYDSRASFYGKAHVEHEDDGAITLYSYNTPVVKITPDKQVQLLDLWDSSQTTLRHVREFLQQNGFSAGSKAQLAKMYSSIRLSGRKRVMADFQLSDDETWKWVDFGNDILREAIRQGITIQDFDCEYDNPAALEIHCNVYVMSTYEFTLNINNVGGYILVEQSNGEDDYLQRFQCSDLNEALGTVFNLFSNAVKFGKWSAVNSSTRARKHPVTASEDAGESEEIYYDVSINDNPNGSYYETLEDAVDTAKEYASDPQYADDEITVVLKHYVTDSSGEIIDWYDDNGDVMWNSNDAIYESTQIMAADGGNGYEDLALSLGDAIKRLASDEDHLNNFVSYLTQHFPEWLQKYANTPEGLVSEFREFANMNF